MNKIFITNNPDIAMHSIESGVDIIMVDLETIGKKERQKEFNTVISNHKLNDIIKIKKCIGNSTLLVRSNPIHKKIREEIENIINNGADIIMLPMFTQVNEVELFIDIIRGRAKTMLLFETPQSVCRVNEISKLNGIDIAYIGLNDLSIAYKIDFLFEILSGGIVDFISNSFKKNNIDFGFGGISRLDTGAVNPRLILSEHIRLGSQYVILSRSFYNGAQTLNEIKTDINLKLEIDRLNNLYTKLLNTEPKQIELNRQKLISEIKKIDL